LEDYRGSEVDLFPAWENAAMDFRNSRELRTESDQLLLERSGTLIAERLLLGLAAFGCLTSIT
jgi:hypothetical protein